MARIQLDFTEPTPPAPIYEVGYREVGLLDYTFVFFSTPPPLFLEGLPEGKNWEGKIWSNCDDHTQSAHGTDWAIDDVRVLHIHTIKNNHVAVQGIDVGATVSWVDASGVTNSATVLAQQTITVCARVGSIITNGDSNIIVTDTGTVCTG